MKKSIKDGYSPYVQLNYELLDSAAWTALSYEAQWIYIELRKQFKLSKGGNSHLVLQYSVVSWRMSKNTFWKKIKELIEYGFLKVVEHGGMFNNPTVYALSEHWQKKSREIVDKEGREAIRLGLAKKRTHKAVADNFHNSKKKKESKSSINGCDMKGCICLNGYDMRDPFQCLNGCDTFIYLSRYLSSER